VRAAYPFLEALEELEEAVVSGRSVLHPEERVAPLLQMVTRIHVQPMVGTQLNRSLEVHLLFHLLQDPMAIWDTVSTVQMVGPAEEETPTTRGAQENPMPQMETLSTDPDRVQEAREHRSTMEKLLLLEVPVEQVL
jgi:hypothetical protein